MSNVDIGSNEKPDHSIKNNRFRGYNKSWKRIKLSGIIIFSSLSEAKILLLNDFF
ncbi:Uncharacterised protein [Yersinia nurmii]|uniref:Uncharacterized protein n=1 Tax=Yersinia nurmii TaxID=685706 RepID=A0ABP1YDZ6_9GAMM|nr:Uncharacterised protein [Yersinia nurmii]